MTATLTPTHATASVGTVQTPLRALAHSAPGGSNRWVIEENQSGTWVPLLTEKFGETTIEGRTYHRLEALGNFDSGTLRSYRVNAAATATYPTQPEKRLTLAFKALSLEITQASGGNASIYPSSITWTYSGRICSIAKIVGSSSSPVPVSYTIYARVYHYPIRVIRLQCKVTFTGSLNGKTITQVAVRFPGSGYWRNHLGIVRHSDYTLTQRCTTSSGVPIIVMWEPGGTWPSNPTLKHRMTKVLPLTYGAYFRDLTEWESSSGGASGSFLTQAIALRRADAEFSDSSGDSWLCDPLDDGDSWSSRNTGRGKALMCDAVYAFPGGSQYSIAEAAAFKTLWNSDPMLVEATTTASLASYATNLADHYNRQFWEGTTRVGMTGTLFGHVPPRLYYDATYGWRPHALRSGNVFTRYNASLYCGRLARNYALQDAREVALIQSRFRQCWHFCNDGDSSILGSFDVSRDPGIVMDYDRWGFATNPEGFREAYLLGDDHALDAYNVWEENTRDATFTAPISTTNWRATAQVFQSCEDAIEAMAGNATAVTAWTAKRDNCIDGNGLTSIDPFDPTNTVTPVHTPNWLLQSRSSSVETTLQDWSASKLIAAGNYTSVASKEHTTWSALSALGYVLAAWRSSGNAIFLRAMAIALWELSERFNLTFQNYYGAVGLYDGRVGEIIHEVEAAVATWMTATGNDESDFWDLVPAYVKGGCYPSGYNSAGSYCASPIYAIGDGNAATMRFYWGSASGDGPTMKVRVTPTGGDVVESSTWSTANSRYIGMRDHCDLQSLSLSAHTAGGLITIDTNNSTASEVYGPITALTEARKLNAAETGAFWVRRCDMYFAPLDTSLSQTLRIYLWSTDGGISSAYINCPMWVRVDGGAITELIPGETTELSVTIDSTKRIQIFSPQTGAGAPANQWVKLGLQTANRHLLCAFTSAHIATIRTALGFA